MGLSIFDETSPIIHEDSILSDDTSNPLNIWRQVDFVSRVDIASVRTDSTTDIGVDVEVVDVIGNTNRLQGLTIPAGSGTGIIPPVDVLNALPAPYRAGWPFPVNAVLRLRIISAGDSGTNLESIAIGGYL